jgi:general secretion pathway protein D
MRIFLSLIFIVMLSACETERSTSSGAYDENPTRTNIRNGSKRLQSPLDPNDPRGRQALSRGSDEFFNSDALDSSSSIAEIISVGNKKVEMNLINATIQSAAQAVLGDTLKVPFIVSDEIKGRMTVQTTGPIPQSALLEMFTTGLEVNNARIEKDGKLIKVLPGKRGTRRYKSAKAKINGKAIVVVPLQSISASQMMQLIEPSIQDGLQVAPDRTRNLLLLSGTKQQIEAGLEAVNLFDVNALRGKSIALVSLKAADPEAVVEELNLIFETQQGGSLDGVIQFTANPRLRSILVISSRSKYLADAKRWISELDQTAGSNQRYSQIYELQNRTAADLAPILSELLGVKTKQSGGNSDEPINASLDLQGDSIQILADDSRNAIIARALRKEHEEIGRLIVQLDSGLKQVLLEATLAEVTLNDEVSLGVRWFFETGKFKSTFTDSNAGSTGPNFPGFSTVFSTAGASVALNALASVTDVKIISSPTLTVIDNKKAELRIGDQVPISTRTSQSTSDANAPVVSTIEYRDTGVILSIQPRIGSNGRVVLDIEQEVSTVAETTSSGIDSPTIRQRKIKTHVVVENGGTLALGGIIQERNNNTSAKVPGAGDIPVLGNLFRSKKKTAVRTELLILIRPHVIQDGADANAITEYWRKKLGGPNSILKTGLGDPTHTLPELLQ